MPPRVKFSREEIVQAALDVAREKGADAMTTRDIAARLGVSTQPIFTYFRSMAQVRAAVHAAAETFYQKYAAEGTPLALKNAYAGDFITLYGLTESEIQSLKLPCEALPGGWRVAVRDTAAATELILRRPELFKDYEITKGRMDDVFLAVTGRTLTGGAEK